LSFVEWLFIAANITKFDLKTIFLAIIIVKKIRTIYFSKKGFVYFVKKHYLCSPKNKKNNINT